MMRHCQLFDNDWVSLVRPKILVFVFVDVRRKKVGCVELHSIHSSLEMAVLYIGYKIRKFWTNWLHATYTAYLHYVRKTPQLARCGAFASMKNYLRNLQQLSWSSRHSHAIFRKPHVLLLSDVCHKTNKSSLHCYTLLSIIILISSNAYKSFFSPNRLSN